MSIFDFFHPSTRAHAREIAGYAAVNAKHWADLIGFGRVHGNWQSQRYRLRFKSALWAAMIAFALFVAGQADTWSLRLDPVMECWNENGGDRPFPVEVDDVTSPPHGVVCKDKRRWNVGPYFAFLVLAVASWSMAGYLMVKPGAGIYRPRDEANKITVRYGLTIEWPELIEIARKDIAGLPPEKVKCWLVDHMAERIKTTIEPFADDVAFLKGEHFVSPKGWRAKWQAMRSNWSSWCLGESTSFCYVNPECDDDEEGLNAEVWPTHDGKAER